jgi:hypothetical protein
MADSARRQILSSQIAGRLHARPASLADIASTPTVLVRLAKAPDNFIIHIGYANGTCFCRVPLGSASYAVRDWIVRARQLNGPGPK